MRPFPGHSAETRCPFHKFLASGLESPLIGPWGVKISLKPLRPWAEPGPSLSLLTTRPTERDAADQRCPGVGPLIRMGMGPVVVLEEGEQPRLEIRHRREVAAPQEPSSEHTEPQLHLVEPGAMRRGEMEHMLVSRLGQERAALWAGA